MENTEVSNLDEELNILSSELRKSFQEYNCEQNELKQKYIEKRVIDVFIFRSILNMKEEVEENNLINGIQKFHEFINNLVELACSAYEQRACSSSFILIKSEDNKSTEDFINDMNLDYIKMSNISWSNLKKYSAASRLVDSLSISYVVDKDYNIIGLARKKKASKSVKEQCLEAINEDIDYIYLENKKILWCTDKNKVNVFENGNWKIKNYNVICDILEKFTWDNSNENF